MAACRPLFREAVIERGETVKSVEKDAMGVARRPSSLCTCYRIGLHRGRAGGWRCMGRQAIARLVRRDFRVAKRLLKNSGLCQLQLVQRQGRISARSNRRSQTGVHRPSVAQLNTRFQPGCGRRSTKVRGPPQRGQNAGNLAPPPLEKHALAMRRLNHGQDLLPIGTLAEACLGWCPKKFTSFKASSK